MTLKELIDEYKTLPIICAQTDYSIEKTVLANNKAVTRMYEIVDQINSSFGQKGKDAFLSLLEIEEHKTNLWCAIHLLEKLKPDIQNENIALLIIEKYANNNSLNQLGLKFWLKNYYTKSK